MDPKRQKESGNALIYVLIAIALFAALSLTLGRQTDTSEVGTLAEEKAELYATQLIAYAAQAQSVTDQMGFTGTDEDKTFGTGDDYVFILPTDGAFNTAPHMHKVYHPEGGGLNPATLPAEAVTQSTTDPVPGWYMGQFNNVEWTASTEEDVILIAYQISEVICTKINEKLNFTGIPTMTDSIKETMIDDSLYVGTNTDLTTDVADICPDCNNRASLCVQNQAADAYGFYTVLVDR